MLAARQALTEFQYNVAAPNKLRGSHGGQTKHGAGESLRGNQDRINLMWEARDAERNDPLLSGILARVITFALPKVEYVPDSGSDDWDRKARKYFNEDWGKKCDLSRRHSLRTITRLVLRGFLRDGDIGGNVVSGNEVDPVRVQLIEADRIGNINGEKADENIFGGVEVHPETGAVQSYHIYKRTRAPRYTFDRKVPASQFLHVWEPLRPDEYRGRTRFALALADSRDLRETFGFEKVAAKFAASWAAFIRRRAQTANGRDALKWDKKEDGRGQMDAFAGRVDYLQEGEEIEFAPGVTRPSGAFLNLVEALLRQIANALGLPYAFIWDIASMGGASARLESQSVDRTFKEWQQLLVETFLNPLKDQVIAHAVAQGILEPHPGQFRGTFRFGRWITADVGYETQATLAEIQGGLNTESGALEARDLTFEDVTRRKAQEVKLSIEIAKEFNMPVEAFRPDMEGLTEKIAAFEQARNPVKPTPPSPIAEEPKRFKEVLDAMKAVSAGELERESVIMLLVDLGYPPETAEAMTPRGPAAEPASRPFRPFGQMGARRIARG
jgi:lambda family phage portal protein